MNYDVVIIGGGMVGAALACALGDTPLRVAVIEPNPLDMRWPRADFDVRVSAVTRASENMLRAIGAWDGIARRRLAPFREMHVWDAGGNGVIHFDSADIGEAALGHIVENGVIQMALAERAAAFDNLDWLCPARSTAIALGQATASVTLEDGRTLNTALIVAADGANSWTRRQAGLETRGWAYDQKAIVANVKTAHGHRDTAWQRFLPTGPVAFLPLPGGMSSIVWSTTHQHAERLLALDEIAFLAELQTAFGETLGRIESTGPRAAFPLRLQFAPAYVRPRLALVGDAAHAIHPLAGQGVNLGFLDAAALAQVLVEAKTRRADPGGLKALRRYERWRKGDNLAMMAVMDGFKRLFGSEAAPLRLARNLGLNLANHAGPLKTHLIQRAMGLNGDLPRLARGQTLTPAPDAQTA